MVDLSEVAATYQEAIVAATSEVKVRSRIYSPAVVFWLMILQRLLPHGVMSEAVGWLSAGNAGPIAGRCKRVRENNISMATGGYCRARQQLPKMVVSKMSDFILAQLQADLGENWPELKGPVVVLDGRIVAAVAALSGPAEALPASGQSERRRALADSEDRCGS